MGNEGTNKKYVLIFLLGILTGFITISIFDFNLVDWVLSLI